MTVALDMFPFGHVLFVVNDNMCTNRESDVKPALKELKFFIISRSYGLWTENTEQLQDVIPRKCLSRGLPLQGTLSVTQYNFDKEWNSGQKLGIRLLLQTR